MIIQPGPQIQVPAIIAKVPQCIEGIPDPAFPNGIKNLVIFRLKLRVCHDYSCLWEFVQFKMYAKEAFQEGSPHMKHSWNENDGMCTIGMPKISDFKLY
jgi:hypothetical protein